VAARQQSAELDFVRGMFVYCPLAMPSGPNPKTIHDGHRR